jgi:hypothetical protein
MVAAMGIDPVKLLGENGPADDAMTTMIDVAAAGSGRLRLLPSTKPSFKFPYRFIFNVIVDPYSGPERES